MAGLFYADVIAAGLRLGIQTVKLSKAFALYSLGMDNIFYSSKQSQRMMTSLPEMFTSQRLSFPNLHFLLGFPNFLKHFLDEEQIILISKLSTGIRAGKQLEYSASGKRAGILY